MFASAFTHLVSDGTSPHAEAAPLAARTGSTRDEEITSIVQRLAGTIIEAWRGLIRPMDEQVASDHDALCDALQSMVMMSGEIRELNTEITQLRVSIDGLRRNDAALAARFAASEGHLERLTGSEAAVRQELVVLTEAHAKVEEMLKSSGKTISTLKRSVTRSQQAVKAVRQQGDLLAGQVASVTAETAENATRLKACNDSHQAQADATKALNELYAILQDRQNTFEKRIKTQASAIRVLHSNLHDLATWLEKLRETLIKVEDVVRTCGNAPRQEPWFTTEVTSSPTEQIPPTRPT
ncbi:MAG: hypothetical protein ABFD60_07250 [Bryobacteraceae bacterium]